MSRSATSASGSGTGGSRSRLLSSTFRKSLRRPLSIISSSVSNSNLRDLVVSDSPNSSGEHDSFDASSPLRPRHSRTSSWKRRSTSFADLVSVSSWTSDNNTKKTISSPQPHGHFHSASFSSGDGSFSPRSVRSPEHIPRTTPRIPSDTGKRVSRLSPTYEEKNDDDVCDIEPSLAQLVTISQEEATYTYQQPQPSRGEAVHYKSSIDDFAGQKRRKRQNSLGANKSIDSSSSCLSKITARGVYLEENGRASTPITIASSNSLNLKPMSFEDDKFDKKTTSVYHMMDENFNPFSDEDMPVRSNYFRTEFVVSMDF